MVLGLDLLLSGRREGLGETPAQMAGSLSGYLPFVLLSIQKPMKIILPICLLALTACACRDLWLFGDAESQIPTAVLVAGSQASNRAIQAIDGWGGRLIGIADRTERDADRTFREFRKVTSGKLADSLLRVDRTLDIAQATSENLSEFTGQINSQLSTVNRSISDVATPTAELVRRYTELPDQLVSSSTWQSLEPEITCRKTVNGATVGYGTCWHSAITGVLQETKNVGGVFTKNFPVVSNNFTELTGHIDHVADHYDRVLTGPTTFKGKIVEGLKIGAGFGKLYSGVK